MLRTGGSVKLHSMGRYIFIRHGESIANHEGWLSGHIDVPLTEHGVKQAEEAEIQLRDYHLSRAFSSDLQRASKTAEILLSGRGLVAVQTPQLRERSCGDDQRNSLSNVTSEGRIAQYETLDGRPPGGETLREVAIRAMGYLADNESEEQSTLVVAHGGLIRVVVGLVDERDERGFCEWKPRNCELIVRDVSPGNWGLLRTRLVAGHPDGGELHE